MTSPCRTCGAMPRARKPRFGPWTVGCDNFACTEQAVAVGPTRETAERDWEALQRRRRDNPMIGDFQR